MQNNLRICFIGDIYSSEGRKTVKKILPKIYREKDIDFTIANGENLAGGLGITRKIADNLMDYGINCFTSGNHIWRRDDIYKLIERDYPVIRPANYPEGVPGFGYKVFTKKNKKVAVMNLLGRTFMDNIDCPFQEADKIIKEIEDEVDFIICDFHAETTSEKMAMGWYLSGRVDAVLGTHTHIPTNDERILEGETGYITDVGMTGSFNSVIGVRKDIIINRFLTSLSEKFKQGKGDKWFNSVIMDFDLEMNSIVDITFYQERGVGNYG